MKITRKIHNSKIKQKENLILCFILGFKPRGDDARPDRGLNPLIKMIFNNQASIFSINLSFVGIFRSFILKTLSISIFRSFYFDISNSSVFNFSYYRTSIICTSIVDNY